MRRVQKRLHEIHSFGQKETESKKKKKNKKKYGISLISLDGVRETTTKLCY